MRQKFSKHSQKGQVIVILLLLMLIGLSIGLSLTQRSVTDVTTSTQAEQSNRAFSAAEAGLEKALSGSISSGGTVTLGNDSSAQVTTSVSLPIANSLAAIEYPPIDRETTAQFWFTDPAGSLGSPLGNGLNAGLVAYYKLDENAGTSATDLTNNFPGSISNGTWVPGRTTGSAIRFNATGGIDLGSSTTLRNLSGNPFTVSAWINPDLDTGLHTIVGTTKAGFDKLGWSLSVVSNVVRFTMIISDSTYEQQTSNQALNPGQWYHVTGVWDGNDAKIYLNGDNYATPQAGSQIGSPGFNSASNTSIGRGPAPDYVLPYRGIVENVGLWNRALSLSEIQNVVAGQEPVAVASGGSGGSYSGQNVDLYFGNANTTDKPAIEVNIVTLSNGAFYGKNYYYDSDSARGGPSGNRFTVVNGDGSEPLANSILGSNKEFFRKTTIAIKDGSVLNNPPSCVQPACIVILARARFLYINENHSLALAPVGAGAEFPPQVQIYNATGTSGQSQKQIQAFKVTDVVPPWFDFALFSVNELRK